jgi:nitrogen regulatory protein P-II 1
MKQVIAIIQPHRLEPVEQALHRLTRLPGFTLFPARGHGVQHISTGDEWNPDMHDHIVLLMFCPDDIAQDAVEAIRTAARTGNPGDGLIAVSPIEGAIHIRTDERGDAAL